MIRRWGARGCTRSCFMFKKRVDVERRRLARQLARIVVNKDNKRPTETTKMYFNKSAEPQYLSMYNNNYSVQTCNPLQHL